MASVDSIRTKQRAWIDDAYETMKRFEHYTPRENMQRLAAISAYASELRGQLTRRPEPELNQLRIKEVDPLLKEVDRQFKIWSRYQAAIEHEWDIERGGM